MSEFFAPKEIKGVDPVPNGDERASWALSFTSTAVFVARGTAKPPRLTLMCVILSFLWLQS